MFCALSLPLMGLQDKGELPSNSNESHILFNHFGFNFMAPRRVTLSPWRAARRAQQQCTIGNSIRPAADVRGFTLYTRPGGEANVSGVILGIRLTRIQPLLCSGNPFPGVVQEASSLNSICYSAKWSSCQSHPPDTPSLIGLMSSLQHTHTQSLSLHHAFNILTTKTDTVLYWFWGAFLIHKHKHLNTLAEVLLIAELGIKRGRREGASSSLTLPLGDHTGWLIITVANEPSNNHGSPFPVLVSQQ